MSEISKLNGYDIKDKKSIRSYDTVALMKADTTIKEGQHIKTKGYYSIGDGGESEYIIVNDDTLVEDGGSIHTLSNGLRARLLENDIVLPEQFGAYGDGIHDDYQAIQNAINFIVGGVVELQNKIYLIGNTIITHRGLKICGNSSYGNENATLKLKDNTNKPLLQTPEASGGDSTHYIIIENLRFDGNGLNQTTEATLIEFHGAYIGSIIRNIYIGNFFGTAISIQYSDIEIDNLWIQGGYTLSNKYAMVINPTQDDGIISSMVNVNNLYIENYRNQIEGNPRTTEDDRANGLYIRNASNVNINEFHCEGLKIPVTINGESVIKLNMLRSIWCGLSSDNTSMIYIKEKAPRGLYISNLFRTGECKFSYWIYKESNVASDTIKNIEFSNDSNKTVLPLYIINQNQSSNQSIIQNPVFLNNANVEVVGSPSIVGFNIKSSAGKSFFRQQGQYTDIGTNINQSDDTTYIRIISTGNNGNRIEANNPLLISTRNTYSYTQQGSIYNLSNTQGKSLVYQTETGSKYNRFATTQILSSAPSENANYIGELALDYTNKKLYVATSIGNGANDWTILN